jgi:hypothetical protein
MSTFNLRRTRTAAVAATALVALGAAAPAGATPTMSATPAITPAVAPVTIANTPGIERMVQSTGNLYWTADTGASCTSACSAEVYRTGRTSTPGQQIALYKETSSTPVEFGDLTYAEIGSTYYGYFVANYPATHTSLIKRIPLTGGTAVTLATSPKYIGTDDLVTDGSFLYWADAGSLRRIPIAGGTIQQGFQSTSLSRIRVVGTKLYFSNGDQVEVTNTTGGTVTVVGTAPTAITALDVAKTATSAGTEIAYGSANGNVYVETSLMSAPAQAGYTSDPSPLTSMSVDSATADIGFSVDHAGYSYVDEWSINPSTGQATSGPDNQTVAGAGNVQLDDANSLFGDYEYFTTPNAVEKIAV